MAARIMTFGHAEARVMGFCKWRFMWQIGGMISIRKASERGHANHGWLDTYHTFSFADYRDPRWMGFRSLRVINDDLVMPGQGFGTHPHRDMEIITYILSGALEHKDSMGNGRVIRPGEVQYMAAGTGILHSEFNPSKEEAVHLLQIWIQPDRLGVAPRYAERSFAKSPAGSFHLVTSKTGRDGSIAIHQDADLWLARLDSGQKVAHRLAAGRQAWVHVAEGEVTLNGSALSGGDAAALSAGAALEITAAKPAQILLFDLN
jgi:redox-sensitive bicupin YhaK (pirin superfamily)